MRFGLVGTGYWAHVTHAPAIVATEGASLTAVWGRDADRARELADVTGAQPYTGNENYDAFLAEVDAVAFSVPPDVQADLATRAATAGKHLLLEKPIALEAPAGRTLEAAVHDAGVASVVFFTQLFRPEIRTWLDSCAESELGWEGGCALLLGSVQRDGGPFATPWRLEHGGLWDVGPHALSVLVATLGPVTAVAAHGDPLGTTHLVLSHAGGASSVATVSLAAPEAASGFRARVWGGDGQAAMPESGTPVVEVAGLAVTELMATATFHDPPHPYDVTFGREILDTLAEAQRTLTGARRPLADDPHILASGAE
ncbi:putative dehydrogenase [Haloactinopolyspora alba]|uniref:Putative dehydrogenase n=1 Tax=Haloactinopolyspora alba TaxID=648780 RepID=A0A2P8E2S6_9ACTN|nr:Gfo/Idh/MocA family oxidoreductase [Haloactinopolyspora alba]PSL03707.1 putative dehydrogenase [Haloactinopolyspora alba]